ncbi:hypothetical protein [Streptococcus cristatus]|uniref:Uncharacterized protein n=1 Tax=Streptococcus cristatus TaxID=45634 RepID=A0A3R9KQ58_STRCR|nr:hypothetical protein [Streptococcus cristatus]RSJ88294.1 hypothetical protein D8792_09725 [Streptococcus cristatus]
MIEELQAEIAEWRRAYAHLGEEFGQIIDKQQDKIISLTTENRRLKRENWNLKQTKRRRR